MFDKMFGKKKYYYRRLKYRLRTNLSTARYFSTDPNAFITDIVRRHPLTSARRSLCGTDA